MWMIEWMSKVAKLNLPDLQPVLLYLFCSNSYKAIAQELIYNEYLLSDNNI